MRNRGRYCRLSLFQLCRGETTARAELWLWKFHLKTGWQTRGIDGGAFRVPNLTEIYRSASHLLRPVFRASANFPGHCQADRFSPRGGVQACLKYIARLSNGMEFRHVSGIAVLPQSVLVLLFLNEVRGLVLAGPILCALSYRVAWRMRFISPRVRLSGLHCGSS